MYVSIRGAYRGNQRRMLAFRIKLVCFIGVRFGKHCVFPDAIAAKLVSIGQVLLQEKPVFTDFPKIETRVPKVKRA